MRVLDIINSDHVTVSCELFLPKLGKPLRDTERIVAEIARLKPSFISVTCGAGGSTGDHTVEIARCVQKDNGVTALAHVTCVSTPRAQIHRTLTLLREAGVENILALRGDLPAWQAAWRALDTGPLHELRGALDAGRPVRLTLCGERHALTLSLPAQRPGLWASVRRALPWGKPATCAADLLRQL